MDPERDHIRGPAEAKVTLVEYGDLECPFCGQAEPVVRELLADIGDLRYVWRHLPLTDVHPRAQLAAEASEAASAQGKFWEMHDVLLDHQDTLSPKDLVEHARALGLDVDRFSEDLRRHTYASRIAEDVDGADLSGVSGTPTFFVNGLRHYGAYDVETLTAAVQGGARPRARRGLSRSDAVALDLLGRQAGGDARLADRLALLVVLVVDAVVLAGERVDIGLRALGRQLHGPADRDPAVAVPGIEDDDRGPRHRVRAPAP